MAGLEASEAVENERLLGHARAPTLEEEQTVPAQALDLVLDRRVRDAELMRDLPQATAAPDPEEEGSGQVGTAEPVGGREGL